MTFDQALVYLNQGECLAREGWNGKGMFIYLVKGTKVRYEDLRGKAQEAILRARGPHRVDGYSVRINSHIDMLAADGSIVVGWLASQTDMLADDWQVVR